jgi:2-methylcitrate dehydratase
MDATTARLVDFALSHASAPLPPGAVHAAKARVLDSMGCALAAFFAPPVKALRRVTPDAGGPWSARVWGSGQRTSPEMAALVSGTMVRYLDLNDAYRTLDASHPSDNIPGLLAVAEATGATGADALRAIALSYEIQCRFTDTVPFNDKGWDQPVVGEIAAALATGCMLGLGRDELGHAVSLAVIPNMATYQTRSGELAMWKGCAGPNGARNGIFAARLAQAGMTGPYDCFEGIFGVWKQGLGAPGRFVLPGDGYDGVPGIQQTNIKRYPVRDSCQLPIDTALDLRQRLAGRKPVALRVETYKSAYAGAVADRELWAPKTRETADHSMPFSIAAGLLDGGVDAQTFERARFTDADVLEVIGMMTVDIVPEFSQATPAVRNCRITASLREGEPVVAHLTLTQAEIERGTPDEVIDAKVDRLTRGVLGEAERRRLRETIWAMDGLDLVDPVISATIF